MFLINTYNTIHNHNGWHTIPTLNELLTVDTNTLNGLIINSKQITHPAWTNSYPITTDSIFFQTDKPITINNSTFNHFNITKEQFIIFQRDNKINLIIQKNI